MQRGQRVNHGLERGIVRVACRHRRRGKAAILEAARAARSSASSLANTTLARSITLIGRPASLATWMP